MNFKNERGITGIDTVTGIIIFVLGSAAILFIYLNMYKLITIMQINEEVIGYATEILEKVDREDYDNINDDKMSEIINTLNISDTIQINYTITKYVDEVTESRQQTGIQGEEVTDLVKRVTLNFKYSLVEIDRNFTISRVKVREL